MGEDPHEWLEGYVATYLERDVRQVLNVGDLHRFQVFMQLVAGRTAQLVNPEQLDRHRLRRPVFESWVVSEIAKAHHNRGLRPRFSFYRDHSGLEIDLVIEHAARGGSRLRR